MRIISLLSILLFSSSLLAQDCLLDWDYYREIVIDNSAGNNETDFQVRLEFNSGALVTDGKLQADGADLRFTDLDCNLLSYFMDSLATNNNNVIWIKMPQLPAGGSVTIRAYYGNPDAEAASNGDDTFDFFDDFESGEVDLTKWEPIGGYATLEVVNGVLNYASDGDWPDGSRFKFLRTATSFDEPMVFDYAAEINNSNGIGFSSADSVLHRILFRQAGFGFDTLNQVALTLDTLTNGYQIEGMYPFIRFPRYEMQDATIVCGINGDSHLQFNHFENTSINSVSPFTYEVEELEMSGFHFMVSTFLDAQTIYLDYLRVRKPASNPPTFSVGDEMENEDPINNTISLAGEGSFKVFPNPTSSFVNIQNDWEQATEVKFYDALGQLVLQQNLNGAQTNISIAVLPEGMYTLAIRERSTGQLIFVDQLVVR